MKLSNPGPAALTSKAYLSMQGNVVQPEYSEKIDETSRKGWGTTFWGKENTTNWFHFPMSVPNLLDGQRLILTRVYVFFHNTTRSPITAVHIYDGPRLVKAFNDLQLSGDHARAIDNSNGFLIDPPSEIHFGLGISVRVEFPAAEEQKPPRWILFTTASAEFRV